MAARTDPNRQHAQLGLLDMSYTEIATDGAIKLPPGALLLRTGMCVVTAFNSATTATGTITDGTTAFVNGVDLKAAAGTGYAGATSVKFYPSGITLSVNLAETGTAATAGRVMAFAEYIVLGRGGLVYST